MNMLNSLKNYKTADTIAAIATFPATSALGVIKISGKSALPIVAKMFKSRSNRDILQARTFTMHYGDILEHGKVVDEVIVSLMRKPRSYTCEDVVEISSHGGIVMINKILTLVLQAGARLAMPGEFTYRAFLNGRISLAQAKAVGDIVEAKSQGALEAAIKQLKGEHIDRLEQVKNSLKELFAQSEAYLNFPEEDIAFSIEKFTKDLGLLINSLVEIEEGAAHARILKEGLRCVVAGKANAGKSTLFNCLLKEERVIVSHIAGTTRDVVEETIILGGIPLKIFDTAGIISSDDLLTRKAVARSREVIEAADIILFVVDGSKPLGKDGKELIKLIANKAVVTVVNKSDLKQTIKMSDLPGKIVRVSALKSRGIKDLEKAVHSMACKHAPARHDILFLSHYQMIRLGETIMYLREAREFLKKGSHFDMVNVSLKSAVDVFGKLTGEIDCEEILSDIFSRFCIGK